MGFFINDLAKAKALAFVSKEIGRLSKLHGGCPTEEEIKKIKKLRDFYDYLEQFV